MQVDSNQEDLRVKEIKGYLQYLVIMVLMTTYGMGFATESVPDEKPKLRIERAERISAAKSASIMAAAMAGKRIVAVGEQGVVLLSDDDGSTYRQAQMMPVRSMLTSVSFADERTGWIVGHWGVILKTSDGGETWTLQRSEINNDQPLFAVYFKNTQEGWAVGLWALILHTNDGGETWTNVSLPPFRGEKKADHNLYAIFGSPRGDLFITGEKGLVIRSIDSGITWNYFETGYIGSLWTGVTLKDGTIIVGGLLGKIYRSADRGETWRLAISPLNNSITGILELANRRIYAIGLDGACMVSKDAGLTFVSKNRLARIALTAVVEPKAGNIVEFSIAGPIGN